MRDHEVDVVSCVGKPESLAAALAEADGLIVRSETRVDRALLALAPKLAVVARAGVGVDAIDVDAATDAGIVVINTPAANTLSAIEQTFTLMLGSVRHLPAANAALRAGKWDRKPFIGTELANKTLGIIGLGRIGGGVAVRAAAFGMKLLAHDPFISSARADALGARLIPLDELLRTADIVTLHVPLNKQTRGMIDAAQLKLMKPTALLINCARGGVIDEAALLEALDAGTIAAAAIDVVATEPPPPDGTGAKLHRHPKVVATPHLGGSTHEALERIAIQLATDLAVVLRGGPAAGAVNAPIADGPDAEQVRPFVDVAYRIGKLYPQLTSAPALPSFALIMQGQIANSETEPILVSFLTGLLQATTDRRVTIVNARTIAQELGIAVTIRADSTANTYASSLRVIGGGTSIVGTSVAGSPRIVAIDGFEIDAVPSGALLLTQHADVPGMIGKVGTVLGEAKVNISTMQVSRTDVGGVAMMILATDRPTDEATVARIRAIDGITSVRVIEL
ncbi:MAG TPA: phosphoglycerate dehydrogenase [Candidatus Acidoferrales bacterium]|nr:phosphoglycerate dehydrogenase [Candidatus Acidoferrales bacterium]